LTVFGTQKTAHSEVWRREAVVVDLLHRVELPSSSTSAQIVAGRMAIWAIPGFLFVIWVWINKNYPGLLIAIGDYTSWFTGDYDNP